MLNVLINGHGKVMAIVVHAVLHQGWLYPEPSEPPEAVEECTQAGPPSRPSPPQGIIQQCIMKVAERACYSCDSQFQTGKLALRLVEIS